MNYVYALQCEEGKIYVGQTGNIIRRFEEHKNGEGSAWTKKHKAISILHLAETSLDDYKELALTLQYMHKYGISNVRGGPFSRIELNSNDLKTIVAMMKSNAFPKQWIMQECDKPIFSEMEDDERPTKKIKLELRSGQPWTKEEDDDLMKQLTEQKLSIEECGTLHERSEGSIFSRRITLMRKLFYNLKKSQEEIQELFGVDSKTMISAFTQ